MPVREDPTVVAIAKKHNASPAQVVLAWHLSRGTIAIPKSTSSEHQLQNINVCHYVLAMICLIRTVSIQLPQLSKEDITKLGSLNKNTHLCSYPAPKDRVFGWTYEQLGW